MSLVVKSYYRSLDLVVEPDELLRSSWSSLFGRQAPLELEIGFGNGEYLARRSLAEPDRDFVGLEVAWNSLKRALRRLADPPRANVRLTLFPATPALERLFEPRSLAAVTCLFPVPWPADKQAGRRLFTTAFLDLAANRLADDGLFRLVTDEPRLAEWTLAEAADSALEFTHERRQAEMDTKYERKWLSGGQTLFHHLAGRKRRHPADPQLGTPDMQIRHADRLDPADYRPESLTGDDLCVVFGEFIYDPLRLAGLLRTKVVEGRLVQEFHIRVSRQPDGRWKFQPALSTRLMPTEGVALALALAAGEKRPARD
ncbi:MAG: hypothetical protein LBU12_04375 [Deltaproteobacteria bacterium]|jgi:tRNA (guanine-N7-)-methyltransferase|nr:hypothetical protein [Deltaproteobacteria bacterium]